MRRVFLTAITITVLGFAAHAGAQTWDTAFFARLQPGDAVEGHPGCTWQWARETVGPWGGWYHACDTPGAPSPADCDTVNGYTNPAEATRCALERRETDRRELPKYQVGQQYESVYPGTVYRMMVLGTAPSVDGVEVVTFQWVRGPLLGQVEACRNDAGASNENSCGAWMPARTP